MAEGKRYYWLKLYDDFFGSMRIKKLRKLAGGDTYLIIYLKLQLKAMKTDGIIKYTGLEQNIAEEIALDIDEEPDDVKVTLSFLVGTGLAETNAESSYMFLPYAVENTGSEGSSAQRMRESRAKEKLLTSGERTESEQSAYIVRTTCAQRDGEKEKEKELELETRDRDKSKRQKQDTAETVVDLIRAYTENEQLQDALVAFVQFRKDIKKPMSAGAVKLLTGKLDKLAETDDDRIEILNNSIVNGWTGIYAMKGDKDGKIPERRRPAPGKYEPIGSGETIV